MPHLENLIAEYYDWKGYLIKQSVKVGKRPDGGWTMELDVIAFDPNTYHLIHLEPSLDAHLWDKRTSRFKKKFEAAKKYIFTEIFTWLDPTTEIEQVAVLPSHPGNRHFLAGGRIISIDELLVEIRENVISHGIAAKHAIPEKYPLLRTLQFSYSGYHKALEKSEVRQKLYIAIPTRKIKETIKEYTTRLGMEPAVSSLNPNELYAVWKTGSFNIHVHEDTSDAPDGLPHIGWEDPAADPFSGKEEVDKLHVAVSSHQIEKTIEEYTIRLGTKPCLSVPNAYALWRTDSLNISVRQDTACPPAKLRHIGWENPTARSFSKKKDVNGLTWEKFNARQQADEINALWPKAKYRPAE
ncbi:hypothetical protein P0082_07510 [Candidatus Haliotispira prima]|uniref:Uncharacterized protein n=1 Tax=Candidatus Haliotispira prima TaxID=3034016 RepID=A0ABY8MEE4_9SPIO|nr:hypothetical protein P0082_07510 [Candidatus Haliotispira prima]